MGGGTSALLKHWVPFGFIDGLSVRGCSDTRAEFFFCFGPPLRTTPRLKDQPTPGPRFEWGRKLICRKTHLSTFVWIRMPKPYYFLCRRFLFCRNGFFLHSLYGFFMSVPGRFFFLTLKRTLPHPIGTRLDAVEPNFSLHFNSLTTLRGSQARPRLRGVTGHAGDVEHPCGALRLAWCCAAVQPKRSSLMMGRRNGC